MSPGNDTPFSPTASDSNITAIVHDAYDITRPPNHPGAGWTRFVCISDTHSHIFSVPSGDVLLHAGDLSRHGTLKDLEVTINWLKMLPHPAKFFVAGNHDLCLDANYERGGSLRQFKPPDLRDEDMSAGRKLVRGWALRKAGMFYLEHGAAVYTSKSGRGYTIYGSPAAPFYSIGSFQYAKGEGKAIYDRIPASTDILITHTPPLGCCDVTRHGASAGCPELAERLERSDLQNCRLHVYGHIHEARGVAIVGRTKKNPHGRVSVNAALLRMPLPIIVDLKD
ncbi:Metallo-dependent phosphatase [Dichomitus squalens]|uniref:Metallo-dependent phosphatase n=1 Tax=Dichomitus squalens TaxID=114155 RepID=A0A4Q9QEX2_9APHY|nr:Metallo-dependent phosphatase [Dichomitus squalens LYAD-421 SS1]EJF66228.1 Metallo-dependent phosphatase [Dichomitus squalens LYAD-421 SS1]TBU50259.1 Metallo-dependent phosphatase [Dichomitus squalens]TBU65384.1 Metallo-dependent phosphatase [Dichomitus squalens]